MRLTSLTQVPLVLKRSIVWVVVGVGVSVGVSVKVFVSLAIAVTVPQITNPKRAYVELKSWNGIQINKMSAPLIII